MPLYEWHCEPCEVTFEALVASGAASRRRACPQCGRAAARVISVASLNLGRAPAPVEPPAREGKTDVTRLRVPSLARPCWMDDRSAARFAAYKHGRGAEYDDTVAARREAEKKYGLAESTPHEHAGGHSPLADPAVFARRAAAARKARSAPAPRAAAQNPRSPK